MKGNPKFFPGAAAHAGRKIDRHFPGRRLIHCTQHIPVTSLDRTVQSDAENGIYYSSIFLQFQVIHQRNLIISGNFQLTARFLCPMIRISHHIDFCSISMKVQDPGNGNTVSAVVSASADA